MQAFSIKRKGIYRHLDDKVFFWKHGHLEFYPTLIAVQPERIIQNFKLFFYMKYIPTDVARFTASESLKSFVFFISTAISLSFFCNR